MNVNIRKRNDGFHIHSNIPEINKKKKKILIKFSIKHLKIIYRNWIAKIN